MRPGMLLIVLMTLAFSKARAQTVCPPNLDFEMGDFSNWECWTGLVTETGGANTVNLINNGLVFDRHTIIGPDDLSLDPYGGFPVHCPNGSGYSVKLGNNIGGHEAEALYYTYTIPPTDTNFSIIYHYAVVLQNPSHTSEQQPRFRARIVDLGDGSQISCVSFDFTASASLPGFQLLGDVVFKGWTPVTVRLGKYAGRTIRLEFITSDCTFQQHFGYAYVDVNSGCNGMIAGSTYCQGDSVVQMTAPYGFQSYQWFSDLSFNQQIGSSQDLTLNPSTSIGNIFPLIVTPFPGFGCLDTLYAKIKVASKPVSNAGIDRFGCSKQGVQLGGPPHTDYTYSWSPAAMVTGPSISNPFTRSGLSGPTNFILKTTDLVTGCFSYDTAMVTPMVVDTASNIFGKMAFCPGETISVGLTLNNSAAQVRWFRDNVQISGASGTSYQVSTPGTYWAQLTQNTCVDTTRQFTVALTQPPLAGFKPNKEVQCIDFPVSFANSSTSPSGELLAYQWRFSDGSTATTRDVSKMFSSTGNFNIMLVVSTPGNCRDSIQKSVAIIQDCTPILPTAFTPNGDGLNDIIKPYMAGAKSLKRFSIYNRYGNLVFATSTEGVGWDGKYNGLIQSTNVFVWMLEYVTQDDRTMVQKGTLTLIR